MTALVPSYLQKLARAEKHLVELEQVINEWIKSEPYEVRTGTEGKRKVVRRVFFTTRPENTDIPIVAADAIYNLRSALDHIECALVPSARRSKVYFPVLWEGVWEPDVPGEDTKRSRDRDKWRRYTDGMADGAVAVLKKLQPPENTGHPTNDTVHAIRVLNILSNKDRHTRLPVTSPGMQYVTVVWREKPGEDLIVRDAGATFGDRTLVRHGAELDPAIPENAVEVYIRGTPLVVAHIPDKEADVVLLDVLRRAVPPIRQLVTDVAPFLRA